MSLSARHHRSDNYSFAAVVIFFCFALALPGIVRGQPINEGFNNFDTGTRPTGWTFIGCNADSDTYTTPGDFGVASPSIKLAADGDVIVTEPLSRPDKLSFWVKGMGTNSSSYLLVEEYFLNKPAGWTEVTTIMPLPAAGTNFGGFQLEFLTTDIRFIFSQSVGDLAFDDVGITLADPSPSVTPPTPTAILTATPTPRNNFHNASFELLPELIGWAKVATLPSEVLHSDEQAYDGIYSVKFRRPSTIYATRGIETDLSYLVSVIAGEDYIFSGWFYILQNGGSLADTQIRFNVLWLDNSDQVIFTNVDEDWTLDNFNTWEERRKNLIAPAGATQVRIYLACKESVNNDNDVYIDYFTVSPPPVITVTAPQVGEAWYSGEAYQVAWDSIAISGNIDVHYSIDNGVNWTLLAANIPNTGSLFWNPISAPLSAQARIRVREAGGSGVQAVSGRFAIAARDTINVLAPVGGEAWYRTVGYSIRWSGGPDVSGDPVALAYSVNNGGSWTPIDSGLLIAPGAYGWTIPDENSSQCLVRVHQSVSEQEGISPGVFQIASPTFTITRPAGGEIWYFGDTQSIIWTSTSGITGNVDIDYSASGPSGPWYQVVTNYPNTGFYNWPLPNVTTEQARIRISEVGGISLPGVSTVDFTIKGVASPQPYVKLEWREMPKIDTTCTLNSIEALDPNNIWVGCACGIVYHWDGTSWNLQSSCWDSNNYVGTNVNEFIAFAPDQVLGGGNFGVGVSYDGTCWSKVFEAEKTIYSIDGPDPGNILAGGIQGSIVYKEPDTSWIISDIGERSGSLYGTVYLRPGEAYVARYTSTTAYGVTVFTTRGGSFSDWQVSCNDSGWKISNHPLGGCVDQYGKTLLWLVGDCGHIMHYNGTNWIEQTKSDFNNFKCVEVLDENNVWAFAEKMIYHYNGQEWLIEQEDLFSIKQLSAVDNRHVYAVANSKVYYTYSAQPIPTPCWVPPTPSPTPIPVPGQIIGRVYDRISGIGVADVYVRACPVDTGFGTTGVMTDSSGNYSIDGIGGPLEAGIYQVFAQGSQGAGTQTYRDQWYDQKNDQFAASRVASNSAAIDFPLYRTGFYPTPRPTTTPITPIFTQVRVESGDYSGDGLSDLAIFRPASGLWAVRGLTRTYFGQPADIPVSGDYSGDGIADLAIFRSASGLWAVQDTTRIYFGQSGDIPVPGDYDGDGLVDIAVFRPGSGLWAVSGLGRIYFGAAGDIPVSGDYTGDGLVDIAVFRPASGLWAIKDVTRAYFGGSGDTLVPGDYDGLGMFGPAIFRSFSGLWAVRGVTRTYFGNADYQAIPGQYAVPGLDRIGVFRSGNGLWAIRGLTRVYYGSSGDLPATR